MPTSLTVGRCAKMRENVMRLLGTDFDIFALARDGEEAPR